MRVTKELKDYIWSIIDAKCRLAENEINKAGEEIYEQTRKDISKFYEEADRKREEYMKEHGLTLEHLSFSRHYGTAYSGSRQTQFDIPVSVELQNRRKEIYEKRDKYMLQILVTLSGGVESKVQIDELLESIVF